MRTRVTAIVPAAGAGARVGSPAGKLFLPLRGIPLLAHTLRALQASHAVDSIVIAARPDDRSRIQALIRSHRITKALAPVPGGSSRAESVARGFEAAPARAEWLLVHDGARPCVSPGLVDAAVREAARHGAVACGLPASLTVKSADDGRRVRVTLDRTHLWFVQTPQVFRRDWFAQALEQAGLTHSGRANGRGPVDPERFPDDAALLEASGFPVTMVPGEPLNIKVTTREDLLIAEAILARGSRLEARRTRRIEPRASSHEHMAG